MFHHKQPGRSFINYREYRDKVLGCWDRKEHRGTLGAPMEGKRELFDVSFYTRDLNGKSCAERRSGSSACLAAGSGDTRGLPDQ